MIGGAALELAVVPARPVFQATSGESIVSALIKLTPARRDADRLPLALMLLVERGAGMSQERRLELTQQAARTLLEALRPDDLVGLAAFGERGKLVLPLEPVGDRAKIRRLLGFLDSHALGASANLQAGIATVAEDLRRHASAPLARHLAVFTASPPAPGGVTADRDAELQLRGLTAEGLAVTVFGLGMDWNLSLYKGLADAGRGRIWHVARAVDAADAASEEAAFLAAAAYLDVRVRLRLSRGVQLRRLMQVFPHVAHWLPLMPSEREAVARVGEVAGDRPCLMLADFVVPPQTPGTVRLASADATFVDAHGRAGRAGPVDLVTEFGAAAAPLTPDVAQQLDAFQAYSLVERALEARRDGQAARMRTLLENARQIVPLGRGHGLDAPLAQVVAALGQGLPLTEAQARGLFFAARQPEGGVRPT